MLSDTDDEEPYTKKLKLWVDLEVIIMELNGINHSQKLLEIAVSRNTWASLDSVAVKD